MTSFSLPPLEACLPHRGAMRLIHRLLYADDEMARTEVDVRADSLFAQVDGVPAWVGIEYMAQTIAAWAGVRAQRAGQRPKPGFLLGTRRFEAYQDLFPAGACLVVEARCELMADNGLGQFDCQIMRDGLVVCKARISVFEPDNARQVLERKFDE